MSVGIKLVTLIGYLKDVDLEVSQMNGTLLDISLRSNDWSESFNSAFPRRFARCHPNIHAAVNALERAEREVRVLWDEFMTGLPTLTNTDEYTNELKRFMKTLEECWHWDVIWFIDAISRFHVTILLRYESRGGFCTKCEHFAAPSVSPERTDVE